MDRLYLDHAATTPLLPEARAAVADGLLGWANPSSPHGEGRRARAQLEDARARIAAAYGWAGELLLTSGASEALAIALTRSVAERRLVSAVEHDAVLRWGEGARTLPVLPDGTLDLDALAAALADGSGRALVAIQWCSNETGVRQPVAAIAEIVHAAGGLLLVDCAQMPARVDEAPVRHAEFIAVSAHKRGGPPGMGALLVRNFATLHPTGGQEKGYRPGTENLPGALGFAAALAVPEPSAPMMDLRQRLESAILAEGGEVIAAGSRRHPAIGGYRMPGVPAAAQLIRFDLAGIAVSAGSACASGSLRPSHVLTAMGLGAIAPEVIRVSFGRHTTEADVDRFAAAWTAIARDVRARAA